MKNFEHPLQPGAKVINYLQKSARNLLSSDFSRENLNPGSVTYISVNIWLSIFEFSFYARGIFAAVNISDFIKRPDHFVNSKNPTNFVKVSG